MMMAREVMMERGEVVSFKGDLAECFGDELN
jgi:hypothetical protein